MSSLPTECNIQILDLSFVVSAKTERSLQKENLKLIWQYVASQVSLNVQFVVNSTVLPATYEHTSVTFTKTMSPGDVHYVKARCTPHMEDITDTSETPII